MPTFRCDKLVRDNIPGFHQESGHSIVERRLKDDELITALTTKLHEEADEVSGALDLNELTEELADVQQIINDICNIKGIAREDLLRTMEIKAERKGGFLQGAYIETVTMPDENDKWVEYCRRSPDKYAEMDVTRPTFITGNQNKADYLAHHLGIALNHKKIELDEIQSTNLEEIVEHKVRQAYTHVGGPVLVEDVSLEFDGLNNLPGPFIKFFVDTPNGLEKLCRMCDSLQTRRATAACVFGYYDGKKLKLFRGELAGVIANHPRGDGGFGWDKIFCPDDYAGKTRAELDPEDDEKTYTTIKPFAALREFLIQISP